MGIPCRKVMRQSKAYSVGVAVTVGVFVGVSVAVLVGVDVSVLVSVGVTVNVGSGVEVTTDRSDARLVMDAPLPAQGLPARRA